MFRVMRAFTELRLMLDCMAGSFISLMYVLITLGFFKVIFALFFVQGVSQYLIERKDDMSTAVNQNLLTTFGTVQTALVTLFKCTTGGNDWNETFEVIEPIGNMYAAFFMFYVLFSILAAFNIVTSIFVDKAMKLAQPDLDTLLLEKRREDMKNARNLRHLCYEADMNASGTISFTEFNSIMDNPKLRAEIELNGLDIKDAEMFFSLLTSVTGETEVKIERFVAGCMKMKGYAMNVDLLSANFEMHKLVWSIHGFQRECMKSLERLSAQNEKKDE